MNNEKKSEVEVTDAEVEKTMAHLLENDIAIAAKKLLQAIKDNPEDIEIEFPKASPASNPNVLSTLAEFADEMSNPELMAKIKASIRAKDESDAKFRTPRVLFSDALKDSLKTVYTSRIEKHAEQLKPKQKIRVKAGKGWVG